MPIQTRAQLREKPRRGRQVLGELKLDHWTTAGTDEEEVVCLGVVPAPGNKANVAPQQQEVGGKKRKQNDENAFQRRHRRSEKREYDHEEYMDETLRAWLKREERLPPFLGSHEISPFEREHYVAVAIDAARSRNFRDESLHAGARIADAYLAIEPATDVQELKAVVLTGLWIGVKFHENHNETPSADVFAKISARFDRQQLIDLEARMLVSIGYDVSRPTVVDFIHAIQHHRLALSKAQKDLAMFLADASLLIYELVAIKPSLLAVTILAIAENRGAMPVSVGLLLGYRHDDLYLPALVLTQAVFRALDRGVLDSLVAHYAIASRARLAALVKAGVAHLRS